MSDIKQYLPNIYDAVLEFEGLIASENALFDNLDAETEKVRDNQYVLTADINGIIAYEEMLNIIPKPATETVEFRRQRIINRLSMVLPFTFRFLKQRLDEIIGADRYTISIDYPNYTLYIESSAENQEWFHEIFVTVTKLKPANIVFINRPLVYDEIRAGESIYLAQSNFNYKLGSTWVLGLKPFVSFDGVMFNYKLGSTWILGLKPFVSLDDMEVIKVATTPSIKQDLLNHMATFTASDIVDVRINGTFMVPAFIMKAATNNLVTVAYEISETDGISEITQIELLDSIGTVLTDSAVYIPILERAVIKHNISIKEGA